MLSNVNFKGFEILNENSPGSINQTHVFTFVVSFRIDYDHLPKVEEDERWGDVPIQQDSFDESNHYTTYKRKFMNDY